MKDKQYKFSSKDMALFTSGLNIIATWSKK